MPQTSSAGNFRILAKLGSNLREGLRWGDADRDRDRGLTPAVPGDTLGQCIEIRPLHPGKVKEALVDGVGLDGRGVAPQDLLNPSGHVPVEGEIGTEDGDAVLLDKGLQLEVGVTHLDAERLRLVGAGHRAAVVIRQYDDRPSVELRTEDPLAGSEEVITIGKGVHGCQAFLMTQVTMPQMRKSLSGPTGMG